MVTEGFITDSVTKGSKQDEKAYDPAGAVCCRLSLWVELTSVSSCLQAPAAPAPTSAAPAPAAPAPAAAAAVTTPAPGPVPVTPASADEVNTFLESCILISGIQEKKVKVIRKGRAPVDPNSGVNLQTHHVHETASTVYGMFHRAPTAECR